MEFDLSQIINGGWPVWLAIGALVLLLARGNKDMGLSNVVLELLSKLLNGPETVNNDSKADRARSLIKLSDHCRACSNTQLADQLLGALPAVVKEITAKGNK